MTRVAVVGMACQYPDASSPRELWDNAIAGRRAFRRLPDVRLRLADYWDPDPATPDRFYARNAAVIEGYEFDRIAYKVAGSTFRSTDMTHWLALDTAARALADAGFPMAEGLPRERTGVVVGNTLTGEFSRANQMRLRWPFVRRMVAAALKDQDWDDDQLAVFLAGFEATYKSPFPEVDEDTLAGALSNTIAGRICNHFDLRGGGYTVDGACSSSLLSVVTACKALIDGDVDVAIAGGVDLSIDPFEIIGFAKTGALATGEMRVYDRSSNGFWPGEGCGMVVLMREDEALEAGHRIYTSVAGWGVSSDGRGGITRPEVSGYQLALRRAYERTGFGIDTVGFFEGHGTGTKVGDATELTALAGARTAANPSAPPAAIGSVKGMIGHTKAAAGVAGLIKAAMAVHHEVLPPSIGSIDPHEQLTADAPALRILRKAEPWPVGRPVRAGVTAMGFGGINTHIVLENARPRRRVPLDTRTRTLASSIQDVELLVVDGSSAQEVINRLDRLIEFVPALAYAELADLAVTLHRELRDRPFRAAVIVSSPEDAEAKLREVRDALAAGETKLISSDGRCLLGHVSGPGRVGFLFPGQGSGRGVSGGALRRRFAEAEEAYLRANLPTGGDVVATEVAQPRIVTGSMAGLRVLAMLGIEASVAVGHSLGEIAALHWAGAIDEEGLLRIAGRRGATMAEHSASGTMASIGAGPEALTTIMAGLPVVVAAYNGPNHTVLAGPVDAVKTACRRAWEAGLNGTQLAVSHAFHSPLVAPAAAAFERAIADESFQPLDRRVISTVTGAALEADTNVPGLLRRQITDAVLFSQAVSLAAKSVDLFVEVGPGRVLSGLAGVSTDVPAVALDTDDESLAGLLRVVGAAYVVGAGPIDAALFHSRLVRPLAIDTEFSFFANPCEQAPALDLIELARTRTATAVGPIAAAIVPTPNGLAANAAAQHAAAQHAQRTSAHNAGAHLTLAPSAVATNGKAATTVTGAPTDADPTPESAESVLRRLAAQRAELPLELVRPESRLLDDLHLSSITVGQVVNKLAQHMGVPAAQLPTNFAMATVRELAEAMETLVATAREADVTTRPQVAGAAPWIRPWRVDLDQVPLTDRTAAPEDGDWDVEVGHRPALAEELKLALKRARVGGGVMVWLPPNCDEEALAGVLTSARKALAGPPGTRFVLVEHDRGAAGLAKTLRLEAPQLRITILHLPADVEPVGRVVAEIAATADFAEVFYDADGGRRIPTLRALPVRSARSQPPLTPADVLLVTGGGKGITAECAMAIATDTGAKLALLGRSDPADDQELAANLARIAAAGVVVRYARADVADAEQVRAAVEDLTHHLGTVTAVLHGAGRNEPAGLATLDEDALRRTFAPKVGGLRTVLAALDASRLKLLVTLGSIIGRAGLRGEAHYAMANDWLAHETTAFGQLHPECRSLCLEWSVWSGVGMGERLSVVESLSRDGVAPISPDQGVAVLRRLLNDPDAPGVVVISGRTEGIDTVRYDLPALPLLRFVERPLVRYHQVELVSEVELNVGTDLYLADHHLDGNLLFPAVFGMEAMAQVAGAVTGLPEVPVIEQAEFLRPIIVPPFGRTKIRIAAVVTDDDTVEVAIRSEETAFAADHFTARLRLGGIPVPDGPPDQCAAGTPAVSLDPAEDLYGSVLFQGGRFQRLRGYHRAAARHVDANVEAVDAVDWFAHFVPHPLLLGDPGVRDALMHGNQVCVPDATLLPAGVERIYFGGDRIAAARGLRYTATERSRDGDTYVYDIALRTDAGEVVERWEGLRLRAVRRGDGRGPWVPALLGPYLERAVGDLLGASIAVAVEPDEASGEGEAGAHNEHVARRRAQSAVAVGRLLGRPAEVTYRPDGRPEVAGENSISISHGAGLTVAVAGAAGVGCDIEPVAALTPETWAGLLGQHAELATLVAADTGEDPDTAATRVWTAIECLQKAGRPVRGPLVLQPSPRPGWTLFRSGDARVAVFVTTVRGQADAVVFAVLNGGEA